MERLNEKYNLDCFLDSELDSEPDKGEEYRYEQGYETLIKIDTGKVRTRPEKKLERT